MNIPFVPVTGSLAFPALRQPDLAPSAPAQKWTILPPHRRLSARGYAAECQTVCLSLDAFLHASCWYHGEFTELEAEATRPPQMLAVATPRTDESVMKRERANAGKLVQRTCAIGVGVLATWLIADPMPHRVDEIPQQHDLRGSILRASASATTAPKPHSATLSLSPHVSSMRAITKVSLHIRGTRLHAIHPVTAHRTRGAWSHAGHYSPHRPAVTHANEYERGLFRAATRATPPETDYLRVPGDSVEWISHVPQRRVTDIPDQFAN